MTFNKDARRRFLDFAVSPAAAWRANFRDLNGAVTRMATLAPGGRITPVEVEEEKARLRNAWDVAARPMDGVQPHLESILTGQQRAAIDPFDRVHLEEVLRVCRRSRNLSEAGRRLFTVSRQAKKTPNDADRLRKYLARFGLKWENIAALTFDQDTPPK